MAAIFASAFINKSQGLTNQKEAEDVTRNIREIWVQIYVNKGQNTGLFSKRNKFEKTKFDYLQLNDYIYLPSLI